MNKRHGGFTLIEMLIVLSIIAILLIVVVPSYQGFLKKGKERSASADLVALSNDLENFFQRNLVYPSLNTTTTQQTQAASLGWAASQSEVFVYTAVSDPTASLTDPNDPVYTLTATGTGGMSGCTLSLDRNNNRTVSSQCEIESW